MTPKLFNKKQNPLLTSNLKIQY